NTNTRSPSPTITHHHLSSPIPTKKSPCTACHHLARLLLHPPLRRTSPSLPPITAQPPATCPPSPGRGARPPLPIAPHHHREEARLSTASRTTEDNACLRQQRPALTIDQASGEGQPAVRRPSPQEQPPVYLLAIYRRRQPITIVR
ncbi:hypothetical protein Dimus_029999, partial [Dionaea muscipula]